MTERKKSKMKKRLSISKLVLIVVINLLFIWLGYSQFVKINRLQDKHDNPGLPSYSEEQLKRYDGEDSSAPVLLALDGFVYDVSSGREEFYDPGKPYHFLAGKDSTNELKIAGAAIIKRKYKVVGILKTKDNI